MPQRLVEQALSHPSRRDFVSNFRRQIDIIPTQRVRWVRSAVRNSQVDAFPPERSMELGKERDAKLFHQRLDDQNSLHHAIPVTPLDRLRPALSDSASR